jgi:predicted TIM-barrel fold metal-dependent hydrolase
MHKELLDYIGTLGVIDSHEHLPTEAERIAQTPDFFTLFSHYCKDDLTAAGLSAGGLAKLLGKASVDEKWQIFSPWYDHMADGSYARCAHLAMQRFYGIERLTSLADAQALTGRIQEGNRPGLYRKVLKDACNIVTCMNFAGPEANEFVTPVAFVTHLAEINSPASVEAVSREAGRPLPTLPRYVQALGDALARLKQRGAKGIKFHFAYMRPIRFPSVPSADAERVFNRIADEGHGWRYGTLGYEEARPLQDYLVHRLVELAGDLDMTVVFHTGIQAGQNMRLEDARPGGLCPLLGRYAKVRFNLLHAGLPWMDEAAIMAKQFPNLYLDMGWTHSISPELATRAVRAYVDLVPRNKILGFGGDYCVVEKIYGHLVLARENMARALAEKVGDGALSEGRAHKWARALLHDNAIEAYRLDIKPLADE